VDEQKEVRFRHPSTNIEHTVYFNKAEPEALPTGLGITRNIYVAHAAYEIVPALPPGDSLLFDSNIQHSDPAEDRVSAAEVSAIGIIGGADGPTAIYFAKDRKTAVPCGSHGLPLHYCISVAGFQMEEAWRFVIEGINTTMYDSQIITIEKGDRTGPTRRGRT
jgi:hypothetical protein